MVEMLFASVMLASALSVSASSKQKVAILDVRVVGDEAQATGKLLTQVASSEVAHFNRFDLITSESIADVLGVQRQKQMLGCNEDSSCLAEIGAALGANYILSGQLGRLGRRYRLDFSLVDASKSKVLASEGAFFDNEGDLGDGVGKLVRQAFAEAQLLNNLDALGSLRSVSKDAAPDSGDEVSHTSSKVAFGVGIALAVGAGVFTGLAITNYYAISPATSTATRNAQLTQARIAPAVFAASYDGTEFWADVNGVDFDGGFTSQDIYQTNVWVGGSPYEVGVWLNGTIGDIYLFPEPVADAKLTALEHNDRSYYGF
jgi:TolB-like protein